MKTMEVTISPAEQAALEKIQLLDRLHTFCQSSEITYFAVDALAVAAQTGGEMTEDTWKVAMLRPDYRRFLNKAAQGGFVTRENGKGAVELLLPGSAGSICLEVYDALPADLAQSKAFLEELDSARKAGDYETLDTLARRYENDPAAVMVAPLISGGGKPVNRALLHPVKNRKLRDILVCVPCDCSVWTEKGSLKLAQKKLEILKALDAFCVEAKLPYFAISKLEISSRMYGDLMPGFGNSAMEVAMVRPDFDTLAALLEKEEQFAVYDGDKSGKRDGALRITLKRFIREDIRPGAILSVIPYDYLPQEEKERKAFTAEMKALNEAYCAALREDPEKAAALYDQIAAEAVRYNDSQGDGVRRITRLQCGQSKILPYHFVYPVVRSKMADFEICCPCNPYIWAENHNVDYNDAANARKAQILKGLMQLCDDHEIRSFAIANLLVGMVTYEDHVPNKPAANWDLALLRADYEKLLTVLREKAADYGLSLSEYRDSEKRCPKATKTVSTLELSWPAGEIRLVPFDKMPESYDTQYAFLRKLRRLNELFKAMSDREILGSTSYDAKKLEKAYKKYGADPLNTLYHEIHRLSQTYNNDADTHLYGRMACEKSKFIPEDQLFPLEEGKIRGVTVKRPRDYSVWTPVLDEALRIQTASIQKADFILIDKIDEICRKLNIGYFICGGSMLGYARNGGFIPWDDDIDVAMLRADYDRFITEAEPFLDERFFLQTRQKDPHIPYLFSKLRLNNTEYVTAYNERRAFHKGICLDIFPFDYIPNDPAGQEKFREEVLALSAAHNRVVNNQMPEPIDPVKPRNLQEWYYKLYGKAKRLYFRCRSLKKTQQAYLDKATSLNDKARELGLTTVASFVPSYTYVKLEDLLPYQDVLFDGHRVKVPRRPDVFLTMQYGDYLQLPPKHNRVAHRLLRWSVDLKADEERALAAANKE